MGIKKVHGTKKIRWVNGDNVKRFFEQEEEHITREFRSLFQFMRIKNNELTFFAPMRIASLPALVYMLQTSKPLTKFRSHHYDLNL